jgi:hypothetical protein
MTIQLGDRVRRNPACYDGPVAWIDDEGEVVKIEHSRLFSVTLATVRWKHVTSQVELGRLEKIQTRAIA